MPRRPKAPGDEVNFRALYRQYRKSAKSRKLPFELTPERFRELTKADCYICGAPPAGSYRHDKSPAYRTPYTYQGIDRCENDRGYVDDNVIPCCKVCNRAKSNLTLEAYLLHIHQQFNHVIKPCLEEGYPDETD